MNPTRAFALLLVAAAVGCAGYALARGDDARAGGPAGVSLSAPLWSARRVPQPLVDAVGAKRLQASLDEAIAGVNACFVVDEGGAALAAHAVDLALIPASTEKLLTGAAAIAVLGPETRLGTRAVSAAAPDGGVVERLWLVGGGDPLLVTPEFEAVLDADEEERGNPRTSMAALADAVVAAGVERIPGGVVGDDSRYETVRYLPSWKSSYRIDGQVGPLGALTVNRGFSAFTPRRVAVEDPALFAASELTRLLEARGVDVGRGAATGTAPGGAVEVAKVQSPAVSEIVAEVIRASDNLGAELLTREIGLRQSQQGTTAAGTQAIVERLASLGVLTTSVALVDGSGLDRGNQVTCQALEQIVDLGATPEYSVLWDGLAVAGQSGTLIDEMRGTPLEGKVRAKTGSLDGVTGLVGLVDVGRPLRFAFVANGEFTERGGVALRDRMAEIIARFPDAPTADALVPAP